MNRFKGLADGLYSMMSPEDKTEYDAQVVEINALIDAYTGSPIYQALGASSQAVRECLVAAAQGERWNAFLEGGQLILDR